MNSALSDRGFPPRVMVVSVLLPLSSLVVSGDVLTESNWWLV